MVQQKKGSVNCIAILGLIPEYTNEVASLVAEQLDMYYLDTLKLFEFDYGAYTFSELIKLNKTKWVRQKLYKRIKFACSLTNTIITCEPKTIKSEQKMKHICDNTLVIYLHQDERKVKKYEAEKEYKDNYLKKFFQIKDPDIKRMIYLAKNYADITINASKFSTFKCMGEVLREIKKYYGVEE